MKNETDPQELMDLAADISDFSKKIHTECSELRSATARMAQTLPAEDIADIQRATQHIVQLLACGAPDLQALQQKMEMYAKVIERLNSVDKKGSAL